MIKTINENYFFMKVQGCSMSHEKNYGKIIRGSMKFERKANFGLNGARVILTHIDGASRLKSVLAVKLCY